ncbi:hypothetical protein BCR43DRAFT_178825 [Syncephalastrum racemosum]|uniref:Uncharacterized protein n=1 Tax=Syncephalastrum racemosum TaxID=13706 RepID=A0A1X2HQ62_SYNRA|nr:hypothetical protein BCR43DRAFT_178825 [Syncephalastrum racemosum]
MMTHLSRHEVLRSDSSTPCTRYEEKSMHSYTLRIIHFRRRAATNIVSLLQSKTMACYHLIASYCRPLSPLCYYY